jgi:hypothetical protein
MMTWTSRRVGQLTGQALSTRRQIERIAQSFYPGRPDPLKAALDSSKPNIDQAGVFYHRNQRLLQLD